MYGHFDLVCFLKVKMKRWVPCPVLFGELEVVLQVLWLWPGGGFGGQLEDAEMLEDVLSSKVFVFW